MNTATIHMVDGNEAVASVAYRINELAVIYPITPSSPMAEHFDEWATEGRKNIWGNVVSITEMQAEGGAAGAVHGALQAGALATTFTASQGLLLMIPNMYKIAGELLPFVQHVASRSLAANGSSIFGDHLDVMACRQTGFAMLASGSVQEAHDFACIAQAATLESRIPFQHFFDGFRTSHEVAKFTALTDDDLRFMINDDLVQAHRQRALSPEHPVLRGSWHNPDTYFQSREASNGFYLACPEIVTRVMDRFARRTGRRYHLFDYFGDPQAEKVVVLMGSGAQVARETVEYLNGKGGKVGVLMVRLFRPFSGRDCINAMPATVRGIAVLDRSKEPGSIGEPLYLDVVAALREMEVAGRSPFTGRPTVIGGRYGLGSKEFTPAMVKAVFDELDRPAPRHSFSVGIEDDVTNVSLPCDQEFVIEPDDVHRAVFFGLGADGTVGANKNSIKIIGNETDYYAQGYFEYDSKKSGSMTISHLRFGPRPIRSAYLIRQAGFVACHRFEFLEKYDVLKYAAPGAVFLLNAPYAADEVWDHLPREVQEALIEKKIRMYVIKANALAQVLGLGVRINTIMQTCFFALSGIIDPDLAITRIKEAIEETYAHKGDEVVKLNFAAVDGALDNLHEVRIPDRATSTRTRPPVVPDEAPEFVRKITGRMLAREGDRLPVSALPVDGTWPLGTTQWEKRNIALNIPIWDPDSCIECTRCSLGCPHAAIRVKVYDPEALATAPAGFQSREFRAKEFAGKRFTVQVAPEDCTGCGLCVELCPGINKATPDRKAINLEQRIDNLEVQKGNYAFFLALPELDRTRISGMNVRTSQLLQPLFEYSGCCAGCGETPYIKLLTQLYGDRLLIANATGCTAIYSGNLPTTPYRTNDQGRGPAWANSLFEDNAEFGYGMRLAVDKHGRQARELLQRLAPSLGDSLVRDLLEADQDTEAGIIKQRQRLAALREKLAAIGSPEARTLEQLAEYLLTKSVWLIGGDGWAFDIGYGGLDHVLAQDRDINVLVVDTEVYSNTGGQASKATPIGASAKFATSGKAIAKKDLGLMAMNYGHVYVASVAFGARPEQTVKAFVEAASYKGPSLIICYSHCIAHGYDLKFGPAQQKRAVDSGVWPLYRYDPRRAAAGEPGLVVDADGDKIPVSEYTENETRFRMVKKIDPQGFQIYSRKAQTGARKRVAMYRYLAELRLPADEETDR
ncbi:MAG TPA: pyruvate:ferredoxin (flavodoxin) oxidoreductase [Desulfobulbus sp.]|nr:pyruvate:ferredoxin (flavodoxin) oxidoreductase [Desulfobulbus sp.]